MLSWCHICRNSAFCVQILETIPISEEVTELVQRLDNFYTEVDEEGEEVGNEAAERPFTRPFAEHAGKEQISDLKPHQMQ